MNEFCLKVVNITNETLSSVVITIGIEDNLKNKFKFIPGQYITVGINDDNGKKIHRCYSICSSTSDKNISFEELCTLLNAFKFDERIRGDHYIFTRDDIIEIINIQPVGSKAKPYQVKQVRNIILKYKLNFGDPDE